MYVRLFVVCFVNAHNVSKADTASLHKEDRNVTKPNLLSAFYDCHAYCMPRSSYPPRIGFVNSTRVRSWQVMHFIMGFSPSFWLSFPNRAHFHAL